MEGKKIDVTSKGRNEEDLPFAMDWLRRNDEYEMGGG